ncbi:hypothetical protein IFR05_008287 [Cadophora sp. M221]|nr:hypothetical protein IFR05_008287 [Cadophora sp. M221]
MSNNPTTKTTSINQDTPQPIISIPQDHFPPEKTNDPPRDLFLEAFKSLNVLDNSESSDHITNLRQLQKIIRSLRIDIRQKDAARKTDNAKHAKHMEQNSKANAKLKKENQRLQDLVGEGRTKMVNNAQDGNSHDAMEIDDDCSSALYKIARLFPTGLLSDAQPADNGASFLDTHTEAKNPKVFDVDAHWYQIGDKATQLVAEINELIHDKGKLQSRIRHLESTAQDAAKAKEHGKMKARERLQREEKATVEALRECKQLQKAAKRQERVVRSKDRNIERLEKRAENLEGENERLTGIIFDHCPNQIGAAEIYLQSSRLPAREMETQAEPEEEVREEEEDGESEMEGDENDKGGGKGVKE